MWVAARLHRGLQVNGVVVKGSFWHVEGAVVTFFITGLGGEMPSTASLGIKPHEVFLVFFVIRQTEQV